MARKRKTYFSPYVLLVIGGLAGYAFAHRHDPETGAIVRSALQTGADSLATASIAVGSAGAHAPASATDQPMPALLRSPPRRYVTADTLNVRSAPGEDSRLVAQLLSGSMVRILGHASGWSLVILTNGTRGWVDSAYLGKKGPDAGAPVPRPHR